MEDLSRNPKSLTVIVPHGWLRSIVRVGLRELETGINSPSRCLRFKQINYGICEFIYTKIYIIGLVRIAVKRFKETVTKYPKN